MYMIVRFYFRGGRRVIKTGLSLEEARAHCADPEASSRTCVSPAGIRRTAQHGPWFDGFEIERRQRRGGR